MGSFCLCGHLWAPVNDRLALPLKGLSLNFNFFKSIIIDGFGSIWLRVLDGVFMSVLDINLPHRDPSRPPCHWKLFACHAKPQDLGLHWASLGRGRPSGSKVRKYRGSEVSRLWIVVMAWGLYFIYGLDPQGDPYLEVLIPGRQRSLSPTDPGGGERAQQ